MTKPGLNKLDAFLQRDDANGILKLTMKAALPLSVLATQGLLFASGPICKPGFCWEEADSMCTMGGTAFTERTCERVPKDLYYYDGTPVKGAFYECAAVPSHCEEKTRSAQKHHTLKKKAGAAATIDSEASCVLTKKGECRTVLIEREVELVSGVKVKMSVPECPDCGPETGRYGSWDQGLGDKCK